MKVLLSLLLGLVIVTNAQAQCSSCSNGRCTVTQQQKVQKPAPIAFEWRKLENDPNRWYLYANETLIGGFDIEEEYFRPYDKASNTWGPRNPYSEGRIIEKRKPKPCPDPKPDPKPKEVSFEAQEPIFGVDTSKLKGSDGYEVNGKPVTKQEAYRIVGDKLADDINKLRITVIGDDGQQKQVASDIRTVLKDIDNWAIIRGYPKGHWALDPGFVQTGNPTIYCQAPTGKVLHRQDDYDGPESTTDALRKAKASYDQKKDPDLRKASANPNGSSFFNYAVAAATGAGVMYLTRRRKYVS